MSPRDPMVMSSRFLLLLLLSSTAIGCGDHPVEVVTTGGPPPTVVSPNVVVSTTLGVPVTYDASKGGAVFAAAVSGALRYSLAFLGASNGLTATGANVRGTPTATGVTRVVLTATDSIGRVASDTFAIVTFAANLPTPTLPVASYRYADAEVPLPAHFRALLDGVTALATDNTPLDNAITDAGATLGRVLFYDPRISGNDGLACAGCHSPFIGFSDTPQRSVGFAGGFTGRHSPSLVNARFYRRGRFFWDERASTLEAQVLRPIQDATEMGMPIDDLIAKLVATPYYSPLFASAFGTSNVTSDRIARALAQYVRSLSSTGSRYDRAFSADGSPNFAATFTAQEIEGEALFRSSGCAACHTTVAHVSDSVHNIGLDAVTSDSGAGRGAFKAPSLRNVGVRPRFMHDGRFTTLAQVIDFLDAGVQPNVDLDARLKAPDGTPKRLGLSATQKASLLAFLHTLTDSAFLSAPRFANPFAPSVVPIVPLPPATATAAVTIQSTAYHPATITVPAGTIVTWTNLDNTRHSASFTSALVGSTPTFSSGTERLTMPAVAGVYPYHCVVHGTAMSGTVIVQ